jgi:Zn finger protein HypA/HybF involved in hydrogenase expression
MLAKKIQDLLESRKPQSLCDACIAGEVGVTRSRVTVLTEAFGLTNDFTRVPASCPSCGTQNWTIKAGGTE